MIAAFVAPFFLIPGPSGGDRTPAGEAAGPWEDSALRSSSHAKLPPAGGRSEHTKATPPAMPRSRPIARTETRLVALASAPFPYLGREPRSNKPFLNIAKDGRRGHRTRGGRVYWADTTYSDRRVLLHMPRGFDAGRPAVMVLFLHGHGATLERDVAARQRVPDQISASGINAVLVAPQFAVDARDSSAGKFWKPGGARRFLDEVAGQLAAMNGDPDSAHAFATMPVVIVGYSGGYVPTAWALSEGGIDARVKGIVLLDGLYGELDKFAAWIDGNDRAVFVSAYAHSTRLGNAKLQRILKEKNIPFTTRLAPKLYPGSITFLAADADHRSYVTHAWTENPISDLLRRLSGTAARVDEALSAALAPSLAR